MVIGALKVTPQDWVETIKRTNGYTLKQELPLSAHRTLVVFTTNDPGKQVTMLLRSG